MGVQLVGVRVRRARRKLISLSGGGSRQAWGLVRALLLSSLFQVEFLRANPDTKGRDCLAISISL